MQNPSWYLRVLLTVGTMCAIAALAATPDSPHKAVDACALVSPSAIEKIADEPVKNMKGSVGKGGSVIVAQCLYSLPTFSNSVSLTLTLADPAALNRPGPRELWEERFHEEAEPDKAAAHTREEQEEEAARPVPVLELGDEAYWVRSFVGTLYVLKGNAFLRISMGGKQDDSERLTKARMLAADALNRLP
jgi:hypothetical protein